MISKVNYNWKLRRTWITTSSLVVFQTKIFKETLKELEIDSLEGEVQRDRDIF